MASTCFEQRLALLVSREQTAVAAGDQRAGDSWKPYAIRLRCSHQCVTLAVLGDGAHAGLSSIDRRLCASIVWTCRGAVW